MDIVASYVEEMSDLKAEVARLTREKNRAIRYINNYGDGGPDCKTCGEMTHSQYICYNCGRDNSYSDEEWNATNPSVGPDHSSHSITLRTS